MVNQWLRAWGVGAWMVLTAVPCTLYGVEESVEEGPRLSGKRSYDQITTGTVQETSDRTITLKLPKHALCIHDPTYPSTFHLTFREEGAEERLMSFLNVLLERTGDAAIQKIEFLPAPEGVGEKPMSITFDIWCCSEKGELFLLTTQKSPLIPLDFLKRIQHSGAEAMATQEARDTIKPVHIITLFSWKHLPEPHDVITRWGILDVTTGGRLPDPLLAWTFVALPKFKKTEEMLETAQDRWLYFLTRSSYSDIVLNNKIIGPGEEALASAYLRMAMLSDSESRAAELERMSVINSHAFLVSAWEKGFKEGREKVRKEGRAEGEKNKATESARGMIEKKFDDLTISELTGLSAEELQAIKDKIALEQSSE